MTLIEKLQAAECGSRELDAEVWCLLNGYTFKKFIKTPARWGSAKKTVALRTDKGDVSIADCPRYTTSIDAALTALPERWFWGIYGYFDGFFEADIAPEPQSATDDPVGIIARAKTGPLALICAILKAREESK